MDKQLTLRDIYMGKPDAKDEVMVDGYENFLNSFVMPNNFDANAMMNNTICFITGYKGTGKTAVLYYLDDYFHKINSSAVSMFISFKQDYNEISAQKWRHKRRESYLLLALALI